MPDAEELEANADGARLLDAIGDLVDVASAIPATEALDGLDKTVVEAFFRDWPTVRSWGDSVYERLQSDIGRSALPDDDPKSPETGVGD